MIGYRSGAAIPLPSIYLHAYPNAFSSPRTVYARDLERQTEDFSMRYWKPEDFGWMEIDSVSADGAPAKVAMDETIARVDLPRPLAPGDSVSLRLHFVVQIPKQFDRLGHRGEEYSISQWYPKVAVYDLKGWHPDPFHYAAEFYGDFGTFDVAITLPDRYWVGSTGVLEGAEGGDNEIPLADAEASRDSVTVMLGVTCADSLRERWPRLSLRLESDLRPAGAREPLSVTIPWDQRPTIRVPRGAPVHYSYRWDDGEGQVRREADADGRSGPVRFFVANRDTALSDTLRSLAAEGSEPSVKTLRYHADRVHDFAWVASPNYVRSDTTWSGIAVRALAWRNDQAGWRDLKRFTVDALRHHTDLVGPYVWPQFTSAEGWCGGSAMEYPMLIEIEPEFASSATHLLDDTVAHESGHNWFYGMIANDERADPWLDEGFAQYLEDHYVDAKYPRGMARLSSRFPSIGKRTAWGQDELYYLTAAWARDEQPVSLGAEAQPGFQSYNISAYSKPAAMLRTLQGVVGDSLFYAFLRKYYRWNLYRHPLPMSPELAAEDAVGRDLRAFFQSWIQTVERPSFGLGKIRKERTEGGYRTSVTVLRKDAMVLPVTVQAVFADGSRQEAQVMAKERETRAVFESASPIRSAVIDPRHEMIEMDRLDNRGGLFPPMRFHLGAGFPSAEAIGVAYGPTVWHGEAEGMRLGAWVDGRYLPSPAFPFGIRGFEGGLSYGTNDQSVAFRAGLWRRWGALGARSRVRTLVARDAGLFRGLLSAENVATKPSNLHPYRSWSASIEYRDRYDLAPVDPAYWSSGRTLNASIGLGLETIGPGHAERFDLGYRHGASVSSGDDGSYDWVQAAVSQNLPRFPVGKVAWRIAAGRSFSDVPREQLFDAAERSRLDVLPLFYANDRGPLRETDHFYVPGGGGARGYAGHAVLGQSLMAANVEFEPGDFPLFTFADAARVDDAELEGLLTGRWIADAGLGARMGPVEVAFPLWLGSPDSSENPWDFRWTFSIRIVNPPSL